LEYSLKHHLEECFRSAKTKRLSSHNISRAHHFLFDLALKFIQIYGINNEFHLTCELPEDKLV